MCRRAGGAWQGALAFALAGSNVGGTARKKTCMMGTPESLMETLRQKLHELSFMEMTPAAQAIVAELLQLTRAGDGMIDADIHHPTFDGLIRLAGPGVARELLAQLGSDLDVVEQALSAALATQDSLAIRHQTHVLIALAGEGAEIRTDAVMPVGETARHEAGCLECLQNSQQRRLRDAGRLIEPMQRRDRALLQNLQHLINQLYRQILLCHLYQMYLQFVINHLYL